MTGIYKITSPTGKIYIGQSVNIKKRFKQYKSLYNSRNQKALHYSFLKHGIEKHSFEVMEECDINKLNERERYWQDFYNVIKKGLNCKTTTTKSKSGKLSEATLLKMSKSLKGRIISPEQRIKLSIAGRGRKNSQKSIDRLKEYNKNRVFSEETKNKIAVNNPTSRLILDLNTGVFYYSVLDLARTLGVNASTLYDILTERKSYKNNTNYKLI